MEFLHLNVDEDTQYFGVSIEFEAEKDVNHQVLFRVSGRYGRFLMGLLTHYHFFHKVNPALSMARILPDI